MQYNVIEENNDDNKDDGNDDRNDDHNEVDNDEQEIPEGSWQPPSN